MYATESVRELAQWSNSFAATAENRPAVVVESWHNGANWYRVWSDGFIEQGGYAVEGIANVDYGLALLKPYTADYTLIADVSVYTRGDGYNYFATTHAASLTHATVYTRGHAGTVDSRGFTWRAVGY